MSPARRSKVSTLAEALDGLRPGDTIALGGWIDHNVPMAAVRHLIRSGLHDLTLVTPPSSIATDMLLGAGVVAKLYNVFTSFESLGLAPRFRRAAESGDVRIVSIDGPGLVAGLRAAALGLKYMPLLPLGSDLPELEPEFYRETTGPDGERLVLIPALDADVTVLFAQQADEFGNVKYKGSAFVDGLMARAARKLVVVVDEIVPHSDSISDPRRSKIPGFMVHHVVHLDGAAHPCSSHGNYPVDVEHMRAYLTAARDEAGFAGYLAEHVTAPPDEATYRAAAVAWNVVHDDGQPFRT